MFNNQELLGNQFLHYGDLNLWFGADIVRINLMLGTGVKGFQNKVSNTKAIKNAV